MKRITAAFLTIAMMLCVGGCAEDTIHTEPTQGSAEVEDLSIHYETVNNMANVQGDDPFVTSHDGRFYYCWSANGGICVSEIAHPGDLNKDRGVMVYNGAEDALYSIWAPELHYIDGCWYIYAAMCKGSEDNERHRMYCLQGSSQSPLDPFTLKAQVTDETDKWAIDGTVFRVNGELYTIWSGWPGNVDGVQNLYIAHMKNPWTIDSLRVKISTPDSWDSITKNPGVNEGPCVVADGEKVYCLYSGNGSWTDDYCVGFLTLEGDDPMAADSWVKSEGTILQKQAGFYGPGHCSVVKDIEDGWWIVYHANLNSGTGWYGRSVRIQSLSFGANGPEVGKQQRTVTMPAADSAESTD